MSLNEQIEEAVEVQEENLEAQEKHVEESQDDYEAEARAMGWKPLDEYKGDPDKHIPAEKFVKRGMEKLPVLQKNYKEVLDKVKALEEYNKTIAERSYQRALADIKAEQLKAVEKGDIKEYNTLEEQKEKIQQDYSPKQSTEQNPKEAIEKQRLLIEWNKQNDWYMKDQMLNAEADLYFQELEIDSPNLPLSEKLQMVEQRIKESNPRKFQKSERPPSVAGTKQSKGGSAKKTWNDIPTKDQVKAEDWIKRGIISREQYIKDYFGE